MKMDKYLPADYENEDQSVVAVSIAFSLLVMGVAFGVCEIVGVLA